MLKLSIEYLVEELFTGSRVGYFSTEYEALQWILEEAEKAETTDHPSYKISMIVTPKYDY